jgi:hypothetical protein
VVGKIYALDKMNNTSSLRLKIDRIVAETINPEHNFWRKQWESIGWPLCKGLLSAKEFLSSPISMWMRILGTLHGMYEITSIIDTVHD